MKRVAALDEDIAAPRIHAAGNGGLLPIGLGGIAPSIARIDCERDESFASAVVLRFVTENAHAPLGRRQSRTRELALLALLRRERLDQLRVDE